MKVTIPVCIRIWSRRWLRVRNILPHTSQRNLNRLLPIWITECCFRRLERENVLLQTSQWWTELSDESFCSITIKWYRKLLQMLLRKKLLWTKYIRSVEFFVHWIFSGICQPSSEWKNGFSEQKSYGSDIFKSNNHIYRLQQSKIHTLYLIILNVISFA